MTRRVSFQRRLLLKTGFAAAGFLGLPALRAETRLRVVLGTATPGGGFQVYGQVVAEALASVDGLLEIEARATKGSSENLPLLESDKLDIGLVEGNAAHQAFEGIGRAPTRLRIISAMYPNPGMFVVRGDSAYRSISDLKGKRIAFGTRASGLVILARDVLDGLGLSPERDFEAVFLDKAGDGPKLVMGGSVAALWGGGLGWPGFKEVARGPQGARFIAPSEREIRQIQARHPALRTMTVPANTYAGQREPIISVGLWAFILARPSLPEDAAYRLARALHRAEGGLGQRLVQAGYTTAINTLAQAPRRDLIHPGVLRYFREAGVPGA